MSPAKFVVLTSSRSGSTWLVDVLNRQPGVDAHGELFLDERRSGTTIATRADIPRFIEVDGPVGRTRAQRVFAYLDELYRVPRIVGFKLMYGQLRRYPEVLAFLALRRVRVVHLVRHNHLDVIVSEELAKLTGTSHVAAGSNVDALKVHLDPGTLADRMYRRNRRPRQARCVLRLSTCRCLETSYEALLENEQEFARVINFLGIANPAPKPESSLAKRGGRSHRDAISNYDEVVRALSSTPFSGLLR